MGPDIAAMLEAGELDLAILSREIGEGDGIALSREKRIWAASHAMQLDPDEPAPLALYPANCRWRQVVLDRLDRQGAPGQSRFKAPGSPVFSRRSTRASRSRSSRKAGCRTRSNPLAMPRRCRRCRISNSSCGEARVRSGAVDHLAQMIASFFQLSAALRPGVAGDNDAHAHLAI
ncbi:MAG: hypothetical protein WDN29_11695 [Methylovirgula sp.]